MTKACDSKEKELIAESSRMMIQTIREPINEEKGTAGIGEEEFKEKEMKGSIHT